MICSLCGGMIWEESNTCLECGHEKGTQWIDLEKIENRKILMNKFNLFEIADCDNCEITLEQLRELELNPLVSDIEFLGESSNKSGLVWLDVVTVDGGSTNMYVSTKELHDQ